MRCGAGAACGVTVAAGRIVAEASIRPVGVTEKRGRMQAHMSPANVREYGERPFTVALVHGGPGAPGEMAPVARVLARCRGVLEPLQTATSVDGQVEELCGVLESHADEPATVVGFSWGAWLACLTAARHPRLVRKLVLVGSGPFEEKYVAAIEATRRARMTAEEWAQARELWRGLLEPRETADGADGADGAAMLRRIRDLSSKTDAYDPLPDAGADDVAFDAAAFRGVWPEAARLRRTGELLAHASAIACPVVAIHGDHDPHPAAGVREPLGARLPGFRFRALARCGHKPWIERAACAEFQRVLEYELEHLAPPG